MKAKEQYAVPELTPVGTTDEVVFGLSGVGDDYANEIYIPEMDFATD